MFQIPTTVHYDPHMNIDQIMLMRRISTRFDDFLASMHTEEIYVVTARHNDVYLGRVCFTDLSPLLKVRQELLAGMTMLLTTCGFTKAQVEKYSCEFTLEFHKFKTELP